MSERINLVVDEGVSDLLSELAGGDRKRGQWLSELIQGMAIREAPVAAGDFEALRLSHHGVCAQLRMLEARLLHAERQLAAVMAVGREN